MLSALLLVGGCAMPDFESYRLPTASNLFKPLSVTSYQDKVLPPVTGADLVDGNGNCAGAAAPAGSGDAGGQPGASVSEGLPLISAPVALDMTECDVVKRAGVAARVDIGANERRERTATLTYVGGERPGIYRFTDGRLKSMELGPEPPAPAKTAKTRKKPAKPPARRAAQPNQVSVQ